MPAFTVKDGDTTYTGSTVSNVGVAILGVRTSPYLSDNVYSATTADGKFIIVTVAVSNGQNTAITMDDALFKITAPDGTEYSASAASLELDPQNSLFLAQLNPGITKAGKIAFDVPRNLSLDGLKLKFRGGMTGDDAELPLTIQATTVRVAAPPQQRPSDNTAPTPTAQPNDYTVVAPTQPADSDVSIPMQPAANTSPAPLQPIANDFPVAPTAVPDAQKTRATP